MGRKKEVSGGWLIDRAHDLFMRSKRLGQPDYHLLALAIGAIPSRPPVWALEECAAAYKATAPLAASRLVEQSQILDEVVRFYDDHARKYEDQRREWLHRHHMDSQLPEPIHKRPSLSSAIKAACRQLGKRLDQVDTAEIDWQKDVRRHWKAEQNHDRIDSTIILEGWETTHRIERVLLAYHAEQLGYAADISDLLWQQEKIDRARSEGSDN